MPGFRDLRGVLYRSLPVCWFEKKRVGMERRWQAERDALTKEGLWELLQKQLLCGGSEGLLMELAAGDGLVGSLGVWIESSLSGWKVQAWEHRDSVCHQLRRNRPHANIRPERLTEWSRPASFPLPTAITTRGMREASGVCRAIRRKWIRPAWMGIWNPTRRPVWYRRLCREGYQLELVWQNIEFYRLKGL